MKLNRWSRALLLSPRHGSASALFRTVPLSEEMRLPSRRPSPSTPPSCRETLREKTAYWLRFTRRSSVTSSAFAFVDGLQYLTSRRLGPLFMSSCVTTTVTVRGAQHLVHPFFFVAPQLPTRHLKTLEKKLHFLPKVLLKEKPMSPLMSVSVKGVCRASLAIKGASLLKRGTPAPVAARAEKTLVPALVTLITASLKTRLKLFPSRRPYRRVTRRLGSSPGMLVERLRYSCPSLLLVSVLHVTLYALVRCTPLVTLFPLSPTVRLNPLPRNPHRNIRATTPHLPLLPFTLQAPYAVPRVLTRETAPLPTPVTATSAGRRCHIGRHIAASLPLG